MLWKHRSPFLADVICACPVHFFAPLLSFPMVPVACSAAPIFVVVHPSGHLNNLNPSCCKIALCDDWYLPNQIIVADSFYPQNNRLNKSIQLRDLTCFWLGWISQAAKSAECIMVVLRYGRHTPCFCTFEGKAFGHAYTFYLEGCADVRFWCAKVGWTHAH